MKKFPVGLLLSLLQAIDQGRVKPKHILAFLKNPERVLNRVASNLLTLLPIGIDPKTVHVIDGKVAYQAPVDDKTVLVWDTTPGQPFDRITGLHGVDGKPAYLGCRQDRCVFIWGDEEVGSCQKWHQEFQIFQGQPCYIECQVDRKDRVVWGDTKGPVFDRVHNVMLINGQLLYEGSNGDQSFIVQGEKLIGPFKMYSCSLWQAGGKPVYWARPVEDKGSSWPVIWGTDIVNQHVDELGCFAKDSDQPLYFARVGREWFVFYGDQRFGPYSNGETCIELKFMDGQPLYRDDNEGDDIFCGDTKISIKGHGEVAMPLVIAGVAAYVIEDYPTETERVRFGKWMSGNYTRAWGLSKYENGLCFYAVKGRRLLEVTYQPH